MNIKQLCSYKHKLKYIHRLTWYKFIITPVLLDVRWPKYASILKSMYSVEHL